MVYWPWMVDLYGKCLWIYQSGSYGYISLESHLPLHLGLTTWKDINHSRNANLHLVLFNEMGWFPDCWNWMKTANCWNGSPERYAVVLEFCLILFHGEILGRILDTKNCSSNSRHVFRTGLLQWLPWNPQEGSWFKVQCPAGSLLNKVWDCRDWTFLFPENVGELSEVFVE